MNLFRSHITTGVLAAVFLIASYFVLKTLQSCALHQERANTLETRTRLLRQEHKETERKKRILSRVNAFIDKANRLGLTEDRWSVYNVEISEPATFNGITQILNACTHSTKYYFKPAMFHVKTAEQDVPGKEKKPSETSSADSIESIDADLFISLKGTFIVRNR